MAFAAPLLPVLGSFFGSAAGIASTGTAALGAVTSITQGNYQAAVAKNNARIAERNAGQDAQAGQLEAVRLGQENAATLADLTASQGASGLALGSRGFASGRALETRIGALETRDTVRSAGEQAQASLQQAANFRGEARSARRNGILGAAGSLLSLGGEFAGSPQAASLVRTSPLRRKFG